ncbi:hypothetical protein PS880_06212 [Pseudomonas fluorescens]|uniref:Uncharacterized protein n=1 Tax=Pseudomonas fluorescens TaxID=294 RepID=A0A5E7QEW0_PSEFL|nr:hypothetical protein PS880_06212 [Pseudomonas fluorescens]
MLIKAGDRRGQRHGTGDTAGRAVIHLAGRETERTDTGQVTALLVGERPGRQHHTFTGDTTLHAVVETATGQCQAGIGQQGSALVGDGATAVNTQPAQAGNRTTIVSKAGRLHRERAVPAQGALSVVQLMAEDQVEVAFGIQVTGAAVIQLPGSYLYIALSRDHALELIVQTAEGQREVAVGHDAPAAAVVHLARAQPQLTQARQFTAAVVQRRGGEPQVAAGID